ncbi:tetratricopeptide repeat protein [Ruegeria sp. 2012CJ41-6]|uniref:Tetratricopeptide repeat protein n=1 Tax=Ruegeria spongiae TaxID=2942209 RepID=A0ABT0Q2X3_9RHOB|nr:tetratricopeptide repeat protein [Ruegeria spongiae]MCL6284152.1 tetratricopeptide repeat protein [Ruegeria spongiae]
MLQVADPMAELTLRERQIAKAYASGQSYKEIALDLGIAPSTARTHINTIYRKAGVSSKIELLRKMETAERMGHVAQPVRRRVLFLAAVAVVLAIAVAVVATARLRANGPLARALPSVAVLPLELRDGTEEQSHFVDALARDIVTDLAQFSGLAVIAANSSFRSEFENASPQQIGEALRVRYVLFGEISWDDHMARVNMQLLETETNRIIWAERFSPDATDLLGIRSDLATHVVGVIGPVETANGRLRRAELARVARLPTRDLQAYDMFLKGMVHWEKFTTEDNLLARDAFLRATEIDPGFAKAYAMATWTFITDVWEGRSENPDADLQDASRLANKALSADQNEPYAHWAMGAFHLFQREHELSTEAYKRAVELNPNGADFLVYLGWALSYRGRTDEALGYMETAVELNPFHPGWYLWDIALAHFVAGNYQNSIDLLNERNPKTTGTYELLALSHAMLGNDTQARAAMERVLKVKPDLSVARVRQLEPFEHEEDLNHYLEAMRKAGVPES